MRPRIASLFTATVTLGALAALPVSTGTCEDLCEPESSNLMIGEEDVGDVLVESDGINLTVTFTITDSHWTMKGTHLYVGRNEPRGMAPGQYPYFHENPFGDTDSYTIPLISLGATRKAELFIAAHADVQAFEGYLDPDPAALDAALPEEAQPMYVSMPEGPGLNFRLTIKSDSVMAGTWAAYSADVDLPMNMDKTYAATMVSSLDPDFATQGLVRFPENVDLVNWVLHNYRVGDTAHDGRAFTRGDLQMAFWTLLEGEGDRPEIGRWMETHVAELLTRAGFAGEGYVPGCGGDVAVFFEPMGGKLPVVFARVAYDEVGVICPPNIVDETAWATGDHPVAIGWGSYFAYTCW